jgi:hypothetical protein
MQVVSAVRRLPDTPYLARTIPFRHPRLTDPAIAGSVSPYLILLSPDLFRPTSSCYRRICFALPHPAIAGSVSPYHLL